MTARHDRPKPTLPKTKRVSRPEPDRARSLEDLEGDDWGDAEPGDSTLVTRCLAARRVPIGALSIEQLRMLIGQRIGLAYLVAIAVEAVERDPFASGDFNPGDLLSNLSRLERDAWSSIPELRERLRAVLARAENDASLSDENHGGESRRRTLAECSQSFAANDGSND